jgi:nicotinate phosphoribosyltransferase
MIKYTKSNKKTVSCALSKCKPLLFESNRDNIEESQSVYNRSIALLTDFYQLTMAYGYWKMKMDKKEASFYMSFRKKPFGGSFALFAGLSIFLQFVKNFKYDDDDLCYLSSLKNEDDTPIFEDGFLKYLSNLKITCDIDAVEEGDIVFPNEPLVRVTGPILEAQLLESPLLNIVNFQTLIATKAMRISLAAESDSVIEFGMRRAQGIDGAISATKAAFIGGCDATSHVLAGKLFEIPVKGTQSHSWIMAFEQEEMAFEAFLKVMPKKCVFLVDTYDSIEGVKRAIKIAKKHKVDLFGIRLDSGDLAALSIKVRKILDAAGFSSVKIMASNELDEYLIRDLKNQKARIDIWGVGTNLVTAKDQSALDGVYKLSALRNDYGHWENKIKISDQISKITTPGILQVKRFYDHHGKYIADAVYDEKIKQFKNIIIDPVDPTMERRFISAEVSCKTLLKPIFKKGKQVYKVPKLVKTRAYAKEEINKFSKEMKRFLNPEPYFVGLEKSLYETKLKLIRKVR